MNTTTIIITTTLFALVLGFSAAAWAAEAAEGQPGISTFAGDAFVPVELWRPPPQQAPTRLGGLSMEVEQVGASWPRLIKRTHLALNALVQERWQPPEANFGIVTQSRHQGAP